MIVARGAIYLLLVGAVSQASVIGAKRSDDVHAFFTERGPVEWAQLAMLVCCSGVLFVASRIGRAWRELSFVLCLLPLAAAARELDSVFKANVHERGHWVVIGAVIAVATVYTIARRDALTRQADEVARTHAFGLMLAGAITVLAYARVMGQQRFWAEIYGDDFFRQTGRVVEESGELFGYLLILFGCVEHAILARAEALRADPLPDSPGDEGSVAETG